MYFESIDPGSHRIGIVSGKLESAMRVKCDLYVNGARRNAITLSAVPHAGDMIRSGGREFLVERVVLVADAREGKDTDAIIFTKWGEPADRT